MEESRDKEGMGAVMWREHVSMQGTKVHKSECLRNVFSL